MDVDCYSVSIDDDPLDLSVSSVVISSDPSFDHNDYCAPKVALSSPSFHDDFSEKRHHFNVHAHPNALPVRPKGSLTVLSAKIIHNVYHYLSDISVNPISATAAACGLDRNTVSRAISKVRQSASKPRVIREREADDDQQPSTSNSLRMGNLTRGRKPAIIDSFDRQVIHRIIHEYLCRGENPTLQQLLITVKERLGTQFQFPYGRTVLHRLVRQLGFRYRKRGINKHLLYARSDIVAWRGKYLRQIQEYRRDGRNIIFLDETWINSNAALPKFWQDDELQRQPWKAFEVRPSEIHRQGFLGPL